MWRWLIAAVGLWAVAAVAQAAPGLADLVEAGQDAAALTMVASGANVNATQGDGGTALGWAVFRLDVPLAKALLRHGADPDLANDFGSTPLAEAVETANVPLVKMLIRAGANVNEANADGETPLMLAAHTGAVKIAKLLVRHGANVNTRERWRDQTALMWAVAQGQARMTAYLVSRGAEVNVRSISNDWMDKAAQITSEPRAQYRPAGGLTPLLYAVRAGCLDCVKALLEGGAKIDMPTPLGVTPLIAAIDNFQFDIAKYLLERGANPQVWDWWGRTPLYVAVDMHTFRPRLGAPQAGGAGRTTAMDIVNLLLADGVDPNAQLDMHRPGRGADSGRFADFMLTTGTTALLRAAISHDNVVIEALLAHGARVDLPTVQGVTPLMAAAGMGCKSGPEHLVSDLRGDYSGDVQSRAIGTIALLMRAGADINAQVTDTTSYTARVLRGGTLTNRQGQTALYGAIQWGWPKVVRYLIDHGAVVDMKDDRGRSPLEAATKGVGLKGFHENESIVALLTQAGIGRKALTSAAGAPPRLIQAAVR
ncbi:MAG: ankyrin repeat domain-containing protein [Steroidobacteraceae bacterium]